MSGEFGNQFTDPTSIRILGAKESDDGVIEEADVLFADHSGNTWYITIETSEGYLRDVLTSDLYGTAKRVLDLPPEAMNTIMEPKKMVWNGQLSEETIKQILEITPYNLMKPFLSKIIEQS